MIKEDYILDQIEMLVKVVAKIVFKDDDGYENIMIFKSEEIGLNRELYEDLIYLVLMQKINEAENLLFDEIEENQDIVNLNTAISFYNYLNHLPIEILKGGNFSRDEIKEGFSEIIEIYGIVDILV